MTQCVVGLDTETFPIGLRPPNVSAKQSKVNVNAVPKLVCLTTYDGTTTKLLRGAEAATEFIRLLRSDNIIAIHNHGFDVTVMVRACYEELGVNVMPLLVQAYDDYRIQCTETRERLIDIATQGLRLRGYQLHTVAKSRLGFDVSATKKGPDAWRTRYNELDPYPTEQWPEGAVTYAKDDARMHFLVHQDQKTVAYSGMDSQCAGPNGVQNEHFQVRAGLFLQLMSSWGMAVDYEYAHNLDTHFAVLIAELVVKLSKFGLVTPEGKKNTEEIRRLYGRAFIDLGIDPVRTPGGDIATNAEARDLLEQYEYDDPRFKLLQEHGRLVKFRSTYLKAMLLAHPNPVCARYGLVESGRTSCSKPPIQQMPKRDVEGDLIRPSDVRRCFIPRPGNVFVVADYDGAELCTLAQVCVNLGLHSKMAEALKAGKDLHLDFAAQLMNIDYDEAKARYAAGDKEVKAMRKLAKVANFGLPGGLGIKTFITFARGYGVTLTEERAQELKDAWFEHWPEVEHYFDFIREHQEGWGDVVPIKQHAPHGDDGGWRVRVCPSFPSACNTLFQGMSADGAKIAMWLLVKAMYVDTESPLYGFRPCAFIHDEFLIEGPEERAPEAAEELVRIMKVGMQVMTPDVPTRTTPAIGRRWDVDMETVRDDSGRLCVWEGREAA